MGDYTYLPYCIALVFLEYFIVIKLTLVWTARRDEARLRSNRTSCRKQQYDPPRWLSIFDQRSFPSCSSGLYGRESTLILLGTRLVSALFFVIIGMGFNFARSEVHGHWQFFTNWNVGLISGYYVISTACTAYFVHQCQVIGWPDDNSNSTAELLAELNTPRHRAVGTFVCVYFSVASVTAVFVTTVNFVLLDPTPRFYNMTAHLFTTVSFLVDLSLNSVELKKNEVVINMTWVMLWMTFIWPIVYFGVKPDWPYDFLDSSTPAIFAWFQLLFIVYFLIYLAWHGIAEYKLNKFSSEWILACSALGSSSDKTYESLVSEM